MMNTIKELSIKRLRTSLGSHERRKLNTEIRFLREFVELIEDLHFKEYGCYPNDYKDRASNCVWDKLIKRLEG